MKYKLFSTTYLTLSLCFLLSASGGHLTIGEDHTDRLNVKDFGATGDGETLDTKAINNTIQACSETGGGTVYFPKGTYLSGSIRLKSSIRNRALIGCYANI